MCIVLQKLARIHNDIKRAGICKMIRSPWETDVQTMCFAFLLHYTAMCSQMEEVFSCHPIFPVHESMFFFLLCRFGWMQLPRCSFHWAQDLVFSSPLPAITSFTTIATGKKHSVLTDRPSWQNGSTFPKCITVQDIQPLKAAQHPCSICINLLVP